MAERDARIVTLDQTSVTLQDTGVTLLSRIHDLEDRLNRNSGNSSTPLETYQLVLVSLWTGTGTRGFRNSAVT